MFFKMTMIFAVLVALLAHAQACLVLKVKEMSHSHVFTGTLVDDGRTVCRMARLYQVNDIKWFTCDAGYAAFMLPNMRQLVYINNASSQRLDVPGPRVLVNSQRVQAGIEWSASYWCVDQGFISGPGKN